jgi:RHS repeat-associated protein
VKNAATLVQGRAYAYADGLNLTGITDQVTAANSNTLSYSPANRLAAASGAWGANSFVYDGVGNRRSDVRVGVNRESTYPTTSNRLSAMTENGAAFRSYSYDGAGNTVTETRPGENFAYTYNKRNRLVGITRNTASWATYGYNAFEQLTSRSSSSPAVATGTVHYLYDLDGHLIAEADAATGATLRDYIWLPSNDNSNDTLAEELTGANDNSPVDLPLAVVEGVNTTPTLLHVHADHLGRPVRLTNAAKATVWSATWKPWGEAQTLTGTITNNLRFPGQFFQIETGSAYNWHRTYDPVTGRYTQPDPLGFVDGPSVYAYAGNSPYVNTDREGTIWWAVGGAAIGGGIDLGLQLWRNGGRLECVNWWSVGGSALAGAAFGGAGKLASGLKGAGKEFSHFIPKRAGSIFKKNSRWNGNYVSPKRHYKHDDYRYPSGSSGFGDKLPQGLMQYDRLPSAPTGLAGAAAFGGVNSQYNCGC